MSPASRAVDPEELLAHAGWVRALARRLVRDDDRADDVAQQTLTAALERPPREGVPLRAWLVGVVRRLSARALRSDARRARREAAAPTRPAAPDSVEHAARAEMYRDLVDAVVALEPIYRDVVVLRFFDGLEMSETAARLGVPVETARTRLKRALTMLRERLDRRHGSRSAWALLVAVDEPRTAGPSGAAVGGAWLMATTTKWAAAAVLAAALLAAAVTARRSNDAARPAIGLSAPSDAPARGTAPRGRAGAPVDEAPAAATAAAATPPEPAPPRARLRGEIVDADGRVRGRAKVRLAPSGVDVDEPVDVVSRDDGTFDADMSSFFVGDDRPFEIVVAVDHPDRLPREERVEVPASARAAAGGETFDVRVVLDRAALLVGTVVDENGRPVAGAEVGASTAKADGEASSGPVDSTKTDAKGAWRLRLPPGRAATIVAAESGAVPAWRDVPPLAAGETREPPLVLTSGAAIEGRATDGAGRPLAHATVDAWPEWRGATLHAGAREVTLGDGSARAWPAEGETDADGRYRVGGLVAGEVLRVTIRAPGCALDLDRACELQATAPAAGVDFVVAGGRLVLEITADGAPVPKASVFFNGPSGIVGMSADASGRAALLVTPGAGYEAAVDARGYEHASVKLEGPTAGAERVERVELRRPPERASLVVAVRAEDGSVPDHVAVDFCTPGDTHPLHRATREAAPTADGKFRVDGVDAGARHVIVRPGGRCIGGSGHLLPSEFDVDFAASGVVEREVSVRVGGRLRIEVRAADGRRVQADCAVRDGSGARIPVVFVTRGPGSGSESSPDFVGNDGPSMVEPVLPAGRYAVTLHAAGHDPVVRDVTIERGLTAEVSVALPER